MAQPRLRVAQITYSQAARGIAPRVRCVSRGIPYVTANMIAAMRLTVPIPSTWTTSSMGMNIANSASVTRGHRKLATVANVPRIRTSTTGSRSRRVARAATAVTPATAASATSHEITGPTRNASPILATGPITQRLEPMADRRRTRSR